jgi:Planctomycete cytochrome C
MKIDHLIQPLKSNGPTPLLVVSGAIYLIALLIMLMLPSCKHEPLEPPLDPDDGGGNVYTNPCDPNTVYFQNQVLPLLLSSCAIPGCHDPITAENDNIFTSYAGVMSGGEITPGDPWDSKIIEVITDTDPDNIMPPAPHQPLTSAEIDMLVTWIQQGAQNNGCLGACDTNNVTYSGSIAPLMATKCTGCHSGASPQGGLNLTAWSVANTVAMDGRLNGAVQHQAGFTAMPLNGAILPQCEIDMISIWVQAGAPNN